MLITLGPLTRLALLHSIYDTIAFMRASPFGPLHPHDN